ncbi:tetratricopeptide repeat protein [Antribacter gilvus]|uniref:tetratricopeptide repeat protein n=1 Tax=Antribacter gilvus TaxID=2304675 RepID=UPI000F79B2FB|nr:tetratricopeptide repeat protein [Antribacter gilvus]
MSRGEPSAQPDDDTRATAAVAPGPLGLLDPVARVVPFGGRDAELADLLAWSRDRTPAQVRLLTGLGGVGKTRLAVELTARLLRARWRCLWVGPDDSPESVADACRPSRFHSGPVLVVIDEAAVRPGIAALLDATGVAARGRLRVLLLARTGRTWWQRLLWLSDLWSEHPVLTSHTHLPAATTLSPAEAATSAVGAFARHLGVEVGAPAVAATTGPVPPLDLHAAALVAVLRARDGTPPARVDPVSGVANLLDLERERWAAAAPPATDLTGLDDAVASAWLMGERLGPHPAGNAAAVPGRLAELHVARRLGASPSLRDACTRRLTPGTAFQVAGFACRLDIDSPGVPEAANLPTQLLRRVAAGVPDNARLLASIRTLLPWQPGPGMAPIVADLARRQVDLLPSSDVALRAEALESLGRAMHAAHPREALRPSLEAVHLQRELFAEAPERHRVGLASALAHLGVVQRTTGSPDDALTAELEALTLCRAAPRDVAVWTEPVLANALRATSVSYVYLGLVEEAEKYQREAITVLRRLARRDPVGFEAELGGVLANQMMLVESGRPEDALTATREAVRILRRLAHQRPDLHENALARALSNVSHVCTALGNLDEAVRTAEEALTIRRRLADSDPQFRWELAWSLSGLAAVRSEQGRLWDAAELGREALAIRRGLAADSPVRYEEMLATSLSNLGVTYSHLERFEEALELEREAVTLRRTLAATTPDRYTQQLARSLSNLGVRYSDLGQLEAAVTPTREAVATLRPLVEEDRKRFLPDLAHALANLGATFTDLGRTEDAVGPVDEAVALYRDLAARHPDRHRPDLARSLSTLASVLSSLGQHAEALDQVTEAVSIRRQLAAADGDRFQEDLSRSVALLEEIRQAAGSGSPPS